MSSLSSNQSSERDNVINNGQVNSQALNKVLSSTKKKASFQSFYKKNLFRNRAKIIGAVFFFVVLVSVIFTGITFFNQQKRSLDDRSQASVDQCLTGDGLCGSGCSFKIDLDCLTHNWPTWSPDTHTVWEAANSEVNQLLTKGDQYWLRKLGADDWQTGTIFEEGNRTHLPLPDKNKGIDGNSVYPYQGGYAQTMIAGNNWWWRSDLSQPWSAAGVIFANDIQDLPEDCPDLPKNFISSLTVYPYQDKLGQTVTQNNWYWWRPDITGPWTGCGLVDNQSVTSEVSSHTAFYFLNNFFEVITFKDGKINVYTYGNQNLNSQGFKFDLSQPSKTIDPSLLGINLAFPFLPTDAVTGKLIDEKVLTELNQLQQANFYRFPGGHWSEWYHWYESIGPIQERVSRAIPPARLPLPNSFGVTEFLNLVEALGGKDSQFIINYLTGSPLEAQKWMEFVLAEVPEFVPAYWSVNDWRSIQTDQVQQIKQNGVEVILAGNLPEMLKQKMGDYDYDQATCDNQSINGYVQDDCLNINRYEWRKPMLQIADKWFVVERVEGQTLELRPSDHNKNIKINDKVRYYQYNLNQEPGYFAWLRSQPEYANRIQPWKANYWEISNEAFYSVIGEECNGWLPCGTRASPQTTAGRNEFKDFFIEVAKYAQTHYPQIKVGFPLETKFEFAGMRASSSSAWNEHLLEQIPHDLIGFVSPHFYQGTKSEYLSDSELYRLIAVGPDLIKRQIDVLNQELKASKIETEILPNEFTFTHHSDGAYGWWQELDSNAQGWMNTLHLGSLVAQLSTSSNVHKANFWHLYWPTMLGKIGDKAYPVEGGFDASYTSVGASFELYKILSNVFLGQSYEPVEVITYRDQPTSVNGYDGFANPVLVRVYLNTEQLSVVLINRSLEKQRVGVSLDNLSVNEINLDKLTKYTLKAPDYLSSDYELLVEAAPEFLQQSGRIVIDTTLPKASIVVFTPEIQNQDLQTSVINRFLYSEEDSLVNNNQEKESDGETEENTSQQIEPTAGITILTIDGEPLEQAEEQNLTETLTDFDLETEPSPQPTEQVSQVIPSKIPIKIRQIDGKNVEIFQEDGNIVIRFIDGSLDFVQQFLQKLF